MRSSDAEWRAQMRVRLDTNLVWTERIGQGGLDLARVAVLAPTLAQAHTRLEQSAASLAWLELPYQVGVAREVAAYGRWAGRRFATLVVAGDEDVVRGIRAVYTALAHPYWNALSGTARAGPQIFFLDSVDPAQVSGLLDVLDPTTTLFHFLSPAVASAQTLAQFMVARRALVNSLGESYRDHLVVTTDANQGVVCRLARQEGYQTFPWPEDVAGAWAVLNPAGLVAAAVAGLDLGELLAGAAYAAEWAASADPWTNPALMAAALQHLTQTQLTCWSHATALAGLAAWASALAADQGRHAEGGTGLVTRLLVDEYGREAPIPELRTRANLPDAAARAARDAVVAELGYLGGALMSSVAQAEAEAVAVALVEAGRPSLAYRLPQVNAFTVGQLVYTLQLQMAYTAMLSAGPASPDAAARQRDVQALLGRGELAARRAELEAVPARPEWII